MPIRLGVVEGIRQAGATFEPVDVLGVAPEKLVLVAELLEEAVGGRGCGAVALGVEGAHEDVKQLGCLFLSE